MGYFEDSHAANIKQYEALPANVRKRFETDMPRIEVIQTRDISWFSSFAKILEEAKEFAQRWQKTLDDLTVQHSYTEDYDGSYSSEVHLEVVGLETVEQYHARLAERYEATRARDESERKEYERLRAKFQ